MFYQGPVDELLPWLARFNLVCPNNFNPGDYTMEILQTHTSSELQERGLFLHPSLAGLPREQVVDSSHSLSKGYKSSLVSQLYWLLLRESLNVVRNRPALKGRFGVTVGISLVLSLVFLRAGVGDNSDFQEFKTHNGAITAIGIAAMMASAIPMLMEFPTEREMFVREHAAGTYSAFSYFMSKALMELPQTFLQCLLQFIIAYWLISLRGTFIYFVLTVWITALSSSSLAILCGTLLPDPKQAMEAAPMLFMPQIMFAGFFIPMQQIPVWLRWLQYICSLKYGINLLLLNEFSSSVPSCHGDAARNCEVTLDDNDIEPSHWYIYVIILLGIYFGLRTLACYFLARASLKFL